MNAAVLIEFALNGAMLGLMYALVAVGFSLFFGVLNVINFSHGDVVTAGAFVGLAVSAAVMSLGVESAALQLLTIALLSAFSVALLGGLVSRAFVLPMRNAPSINVLLMTLMIGLALREAIRLFYPDGANPQRFPKLLPTTAYDLWGIHVRLDGLLLLAFGIVLIAVVSGIISRTRLGLAIRAVAQDPETAQVMGMNFGKVVFLTFALGSALAGAAGIMHGLYYNEVNFTLGLLLGVIGFSAAVLGGLGGLWGAVIGGFVFAFLQTAWVVVLPEQSGYKNVVAFGVIILLLTLRPTGLIAERKGERV